ncbi:hypothetical protein [Rhodopila sp.]|uniref:hypothetical protein n=1 Tax=Rhodopila sp. TaxID=2480087 RepID=UPI003D0E9035
MSSYKLHYFPASENSYKSALMLTLCGQRFEPIWTNFGSGITWTDEWRRNVNPIGEILGLVEDGVSLIQTALNTSAPPRIVNRILTQCLIA